MMVFVTSGSEDPCKVLNGGCQHSCRLDARGDVMCSCHDKYTLLSDGKTCVCKCHVTSACLSDLFV